MMERITSTTPTIGYDREAIWSDTVPLQLYDIATVRRSTRASGTFSSLLSFL